MIKVKSKFNLKVTQLSNIILKHQPHNYKNLEVELVPDDADPVVVLRLAAVAVRRVGL